MYKVSTPTERPARPYDFERQGALERTRLRRIQPVLDVLAHRIAGSLTSTLRVPSRVEVGELEQHRWEEYTAELPDTTFLAAVAVAPHGGRIVLHLPLPLSLAVVDVRLGGSGTGRVAGRALTDFEQRLVGEAAQGALAEITPAFAPVITVSLGAVTLVTNPMFLPAANPAENCLLVTLKVRLGDGVEHTASICLPTTVLLPMLDTIERIEQGSTDAGTDAAVAAEVRERVLHAPVEVAVRYPDVVMSSADLLSLSPGDLIALHRDPATPVQLTVSGVAFCHVQPTTRNKRLACMVVASGEDQENV